MDAERSIQYRHASKKGVPVFNFTSVAAGCVLPSARQRRTAGFVRILPLLFAVGGCDPSARDPFAAPATRALTGSPAFVQLNYATPQSSVTTVDVPFTAAQSAGSLNVVAVGWNDTTARVVSVTDTKGNAYQPAVGPTTLAGALSQSIYYAPNVAPAAAGVNVVTVSFTAAARFADVRIVEYSGVASVSPVDVTAAATGQTSTSSTPPLVTTNASDLLFAANTVWTTTAGPGSGWTSRVITNPDGDIAEDRMVSALGSYAVTAPLSGAGPWVMQAVAFKAEATAPPPPPTAPTNLSATAAGISRIDLSWTNTSTSQTGVKIERSIDNVTFTQIALAGPAAVSYSDTGLSASTTYAYRVRATNPSGDSAYSNVASATTQSPPPPPSAPTSLLATPASSSQIDLSWTNTSTSQTGVKIERSIDNVNFTQIALAAAAAVSYSDTGLRASTTYAYRVRATNASGDSAYSDVASATTPAAPTVGSRPTLVQHVSSSTNPPGKGIPGNSFKFTLPNAVGAGNCLILGISYAWSASRTVSITDSNGNTWPSSPAVTVTGGAQVISSIFVLPNANAGVTTITVTFDASLLPFQYTISEFYDVAAVSPVNGTSRSSTTSGSTAGGTVASGSFTPGNNDANGGNLIWTYLYDNANPGSGNEVTTFAAGTSFTLLDADIAWGADANAHHASEYFVQTAAAPINPSMTVTMAPGGDPFNAVSVALKAAPAGTAPPPGIRIVRISHCTRQAGIPGAWKHQFPTSGNLIVAVTNENAVIDITSVADSKGNLYSKVEPDGSEPQFWYAGNATPDANLKLTLNVSGPPAGSTVVFYDIAGADPSPFDVSAGTPVANCSNLTNVTNAPSITPTTINGLTLASMSLGQGPATGFFTGAPAGAIFDLVTYAGETDLDTMDNADAKAHLYNTDLSTESWNYRITSNPENSCSSTAVHFKAAPR